MFVDVVAATHDGLDGPLGTRPDQRFAAEVLVAAVSAFLLGGIWYGPLFKHAWCRENGIDPDAPPPEESAE